MALARLVYASTANENFSGAELNNILAQSRLNNKKHNVSGMLCFNNRYIIQILEGSPEAVNGTYLKIAQDPRHSELMLLDYSPIHKRQFSEWSMGFAAETRESRKIYFAYSPTDEFNPYRLLGEASANFLFEMSRLLPVE